MRSNPSTTADIVRQASSGNQRPQTGSSGQGDADRARAKSKREREMAMQRKPGKPKKGTLLYRAMRDKNASAGNFDKKDLNRARSFLKHNYAWARKRDGKDVDKAAAHLLGRPGSALGATGRPDSIGVRAKDGPKKLPKGVSDEEFKREVARYKAKHRAARDPKKAKNVEAIVRTILAGRKKKDKKPPRPAPRMPAPPSDAEMD